MSIVNKVLKQFVGDKNQKALKHYKKIVEQVHSFEKEYSELSIDELRGKTQFFKEKIQSATEQQLGVIADLKSKIEAEKNINEKEKLYEVLDAEDKKLYQIEEEALKEIHPEAFALVKETAKRFTENTEIAVNVTDFDREIAESNDYVTIEEDKAIWKNTWDAAGKEVTWNMVHYDVQLIGGSVIHEGKIAEMATGEGKTLMATLPIYLNALSARGVHVITVNDYLARRDAAWMSPIFQFYGLSIDCIDNHPSNSEARRKAYQCDITYGTNNEFGFDYLRDNGVTSAEKLVQRPHNFAIIDEVDSVLIDDARTPLIISGPVPEGDRHEFDELRPRISHLVSLQRQELSKTFTEAKKLLSEGDKKEGGEKLYRVFRGLPKYKPLIKFLSQEGIKQQLQKTEGYFMQDNNREMPKIDQHLYFAVNEKNNTVELTDRGIDALSKNMEDKGFFILPEVGAEVAEIERLNLPKEEEMAKKDELFRDYAIKSERIHTLNQLLKAFTVFEKDVDYVVMDGKVKIVDEQTGRIMDGRRYSDGLHQALEAKENVTIEAATQTYATVTLQNYFRMYNKLSGMTGTAVTEAGEFWEIYKLDVVEIPTNRPIARKDKEDIIFKTAREKYNGVIEEITRITQEEKRPVLVGTTSVEISELLSRALKMRKIKHNVLNAKLHEKEADVVAEAGSAGVVTIATNMAGRGTDIKLTEEVKAAGGLAIIGTERHDSRRVDRQLRGRAGRQGDPGSSQFFVSLEDQLMRIFGSERITKVMDRMGHKEGETIQHSMVSKSIERAQRKVEENNFGVRKNLLEYDDVMNKQREVIYKRRKNALLGERLAIDIDNMIYDTVVSVVNENKALNDYDAFGLELIKFFTMDNPVSEDEFKDIKEQDLIEKVYALAIEDYRMKSNHMADVLTPVVENIAASNQNFRRINVPFTDGIKVMNVNSDLLKAVETKGKSIVTDFEKGIVLNFIDEHWKEHLRDMDDLRRSVRTATYEQKNPLVVYKEESFYLFRSMLDRLNKEIVPFLYKGELPKREESQEQITEEQKREEVQTQTSRSTESSSSEEQNKEAEAPKQQPKRVVKIGRNEKVEIINPANGETQVMKFKQALPLLESGQWKITKKVEG